MGWGFERQPIKRHQEAFFFGLTVGICREDEREGIENMGDNAIISSRRVCRSVASVIPHDSSHSDSMTFAHKSAKSVYVVSASLNHFVFQPGTALR